MNCANCGVPLPVRISVLAAAFAVARVSASAQAGPGGAQQAVIPVRSLGAPQAVSAEALGTNLSIRELSDGRVLVNDALRQRVILLDATLASFKVVIDSGSPATNVGTARMGGLIAYRGDSTIFVDFPSQVLAAITPSGTLGRTMALPRALDLMYLTNPIATGTPAFDPRGRLLYRTNLRGTTGPASPGSDATTSSPADSAVIVRADLETRITDTITTLKSQRLASTTMTPNPRGGPAAMKMHMNPISPADEFGILPDGSVAIVRAQDYHIDWVDADGSRRSTPKMPYDWRPLTDTDKQRVVDSVQTAFAAARANPPKMPSGSPVIVPDIDFVPFGEMPDYYPAVQPGSVRVDLDGNLWILPRTSSHAQGGALYDVVNRSGTITQRVQLAGNRAIVGFGRNGMVYTMVVTGSVAHLERSHPR